MPHYQSFTFESNNCSPHAICRSLSDAFRGVTEEEDSFDAYLLRYQTLDGTTTEKQEDISLREFANLPYLPKTFELVTSGLRPDSGVQYCSVELTPSNELRVFVLANQADDVAAFKAAFAASLNSAPQVAKPGRLNLDDALAGTAEIHLAAIGLRKLTRSNVGVRLGESSGKTVTGQQPSRGEALEKFLSPTKIGSGENASVWRFVASDLLRPVAIKFLHHSTDTDAALREGRALAQFAHPNVVRVYECVTMPHPEHGRLQPALVLEYVDGATLAKRIELGAFALEAAKLYAKQLVSVLIEFRRADFIHGDLHDENIMISETRLVVLDPWSARMEKRVSTMSRDQRKAYEFNDCREAVHHILCRADYDGRDRSVALRAVHRASTPDALRDAVKDFGKEHAPRSEAPRKSPSVGPKPPPIQPLPQRLHEFLTSVNPEIVARFKDGIDSVHVMLSPSNALELARLKGNVGFDALLEYRPTGSAIIASRNSRIGDAINDLDDSGMLNGYRLQIRLGFLAYLLHG